MAKRRARRATSKTQHEDHLLFQIRALKLSEPEREFVFHPTRRWRFDFAWPSLYIAAECEGGVWSGGRHTTPSGFTDDCEKYNAAAVLGWRVLRFPSKMIESGAAIRVIVSALSETTSGE